MVCVCGCVLCLCVRSRCCAPPHSRDHSVDEGLSYIATWNAAMLQTADIREGVTAFTTKQQPAFADVDHTYDDV